MKVCPLCRIIYFSLEEYIFHIKEKHVDTLPETFIKYDTELKHEFYDTRR